MRVNAILMSFSLLIAPVVLTACAPQSFTRKVVQFEDGSSAEVEVYKASEKNDFTKNAVAKYHGGEFSPNNYAFTSKLIMSFYQDELAGTNSQPDVPESRSMNLGFLMELGQSYGILPGRSVLGKGGASAAILLDLTQPNSPRERFEKNRYGAYVSLVSPHISFYRIDPIADGNYQDEVLDAKMASIFVDVRKIVKALPYSCKYRRETQSMGASRSLAILKCTISGSEKTIGADAKVIRANDQYIETVIRDIVGPHIITIVQLPLPTFNATKDALEATKSLVGKDWYVSYAKEATDSERIVVVEKDSRTREYRFPIVAGKK